MGITKLNKFSLVDLLKEFNLEKIQPHPFEGITINNLCADSRNAQPGDLFVAIPCAQVISHVKEAIEKGAVAVLATSAIAKEFISFKNIIFIENENPRLSLSVMAKTFFKDQPEILMAVTGTNGKTSVVSIIRQLWELLGYSATSFGTMGVEITKQALSSNPLLPKMPSNLNTYDSLSFFHLLQSLYRAEINHAVFEASSIGLDQFRIHGCRLCVAGFTNFTQDHLDYHKTMEDYFHAKVKLFTEVLSSGKSAVLNANSPYAKRLEEIAIQRGIQILTYAINAPADLIATKIQTQGSAITFDLEYKGQMVHNIILNLAGAFQVENMLCALGMLIASGISLEKILPIIPKLKSIAGRMELIGKTLNGGDVYVDYAHTPDALERALKSLRVYTKNAIWVVFGCGGDRDRQKRPLMGKIASDLADKIIVTDDNPRSEEASSIRKQILSECASKGHEIADRSQAIAYAIAHLEKGDTLLIAGKGHETGQMVGDVIYPFSDRQEAEKALNGLNT